MNRDHAQRVLFEQLKRTVPISAVLAKYGIELKRQGNSLKGCCPVHKGSNSRQFVVDEAKGLWRCFSPSCDRGGGMLELVAEFEKVDVKQAALLVAEWFCIKPGSDVQHRKPKERAMSGEKPSHKVFVVEGEGDNAFWHRAGSAWQHKDGKGLNMQIPTGMSLSGRVVLREYTEDDAEQEAKTRRKR